MENRVKLSVLGFSFNQTQSGAYGLVLSEEGGVRRLMVIVGTPEAQSIAFKLQDSAPPRPLTHDLIKTILSQLNVTLREVEIYKYEDGIFFSRIILEQEDKVIQLESRTSDAVAIALRTQSPIYTTEQIMKDHSIVFDENAAKETTKEEEVEETKKEIDYSLLNKSELEALLQEAVAGENYELASLLRDELDKKKNKE
ncbi:bifunctional nuclease family protein [Dysgonomonas sp. Marseille-P4361]|uniref:bifunctional nuclease family protein n=1 Tax=Dysgonomonas sp. Marseille-P4361 TaxID=2161820 RepID=UPI000D55BC7F|nr:bifunctional nuclease family protein [Dysgonomonas sp. Marseille-P4361]